MAVWQPGIHGESERGEQGALACNRPFHRFLCTAAAGRPGTATMTSGAPTSATATAAGSRPSRALAEGQGKKNHLLSRDKPRVTSATQ